MTKCLRFSVMTLCLGLFSFLQAYSQCIPPTVTKPSDQVVCNGSTTAAINFTGTGTMYRWTNSNPAIGLAASGVGNIPAFTATNTGTTPITSTITVTPYSQTSYAYATLPGFNRISVINTTPGQPTTDREIALIATDPIQTEPYGVTVSPDGTRAYVANATSNTVTAINTATNAVIADAIRVGNRPIGMIVSPNGDMLYVANYNSNSISVIRTSDNTVLEASIPTGGNGPQGIAISPDGTRLYVANTESDNVSVFNTANLLETPATINVGNEPVGIALSPDGTRLYVANSRDNNVSVINFTTNSTTTISTGPQPWGIAVSPDGNKIYVANFSGSLSIRDLVDASKNDDIGTAAFTSGVSVSPDGGKVYVFGQGVRFVTVVDVNNSNAVSFVELSGHPAAFGNAIATFNSCTGISQTFTITVNPANTAITTQPTDRTACEGGTATFTVAATGTNLSYQWRQGTQDIGTATANNTLTLTNVTAASAGSYTVVVTGDCGAPVTSASATLTVTPTPTVNSAATGTVCSGVAQNYTITSATTGTTFTWSRAAVAGISNAAVSGQTANSITETLVNTTTAPITVTYTITPTANGCTGADFTYTVTVNPATTITTQPAATQTVCAGTAVSFSVAATGTAPLTYQWRRGGLNVATGPTFTINTPSSTDAGSYTVEVTGGCGSVTSTSSTLVVNAIPAAPTVTASGPLTFCQGGNVVLTSSETTGNQWLLGGNVITGATNQTFTANQSGSYSVRTTQNGCSSAASTASVVTVNSTPPIPTVTQNGNLLTSSAATGNQWLLGGNVITGATGQTHRVQARGIYTVQVTQNGCTSISAPFNYVVTNIDPVTGSAGISVYPSPVADYLHVKNETGKALTLQLFNISGTKVREVQLLTSQTTINVMEFANGSYYLRITNPVTKQSSVHAVIIQH